MPVITVQFPLASYWSASALPSGGGTGQPARRLIPVVVLLQESWQRVRSPATSHVTVRVTMLVALCLYHATGMPLLIGIRTLSISLLLTLEFQNSIRPTAIQRREQQSVRSTDVADTW